MNEEKPVLPFLQNLNNFCFLSSILPSTKVEENELKINFKQMKGEIITKEMLNSKDKKLLEDALKKNINDLSDFDKEIIKARREYLSSVELNAFRSVIEEEQDKEEKDITCNEIKEKLSKLGVEYSKNGKKEELLKLLKETTDKIVE